MRRRMKISDDDDDDLRVIKKYTVVVPGFRGSPVVMGRRPNKHPRAVGLLRGGEGLWALRRGCDEAMP